MSVGFMNKVNKLKHQKGERDNSTLSNYDQNDPSMKIDDECKKDGNVTKPILDKLQNRTLFLQEINLTPAQVRGLI